MRWQYQVIEVKPSLMGAFKQEVLQEALVRQGQLGWELVQIVSPGRPRPAGEARRMSMVAASAASHSGVR